MKTIILLLTLLVAAPLLAQDLFKPEEKGLSDFEDLELGQKTSKNKKSKKEEKEFLGTADHKQQIQLLYLNNFYQYTQKGSGVTYDLANDSGNGVFIKFDRWIEDNSRQMSFTIMNSQSDFQEPTSIGGLNAKVSKTYLAATYHKYFWHNEAEKSSYSFEFGAGFLSQKPGTFTSDQLVSDYTILGPIVALNYNKILKHRWSVKARAGLLLPMIFNEGTNTGYHDFSAHTLTSGIFSYVINENLNFDFGLILEYEWHKFSGSGDRGVTDAKDSYLNYSLPIGLTYLF
ncbi:MAG: hypothetical protein JNM93_11435 [Bacteriovoracaceae bacterium]|nr:hypothetical protein [Bacteriovoracaceae bacterium]